jgi:hypothetical protein
LSERFVINDGQALEVSGEKGRLFDMVLSGSCSCAWSWEQELEVSETAFDLVA